MGGRREFSIIFYLYIIFYIIFLPLYYILSHYILKRFFRQSAINDNDVSAGKSNIKCHSIYLCRYSLRFGNLRPGNRLLK